MERELTTTELLAALVATKNLDLPDTVAITEYAEHVNVQYETPAETLEQALDMALDFFNDAPDVEAAKQEAKIQAIRETPHDADTCPDCGGAMMDDDDFSHALDLWVAIRTMVDKYNFDTFHEVDGRDEC